MDADQLTINVRAPVLNPPRAETWRWWVAGVGFVLGMVGVFLLPWFVPVSSTPIDAESWSAGFNNTVAVVSALLAAVMIGVAGFPGARAGVRIFSPAAERVRMPWWPVALASAMFVVQACVLAVSGAVVGDAAFHLDRAANVLAGGRLFVDVEYPYGPGLLSAVIWAGRLATAVGFQPRVGYYALLAAVTVSSMLLLALVLGRLDMPKGLKIGLFATFALLLWLFENQYAGVQYGFVRYLGALGALVVLRELVRTEAGTGRLGIAWRAVVAALLAVVTMMVSPDAGIAYALAATVVLIPVSIRSPRRWYILAGHVAGMALLVVVMGGDALRSLALFGGGFGLFPVVPGPSTLILLAALWFVAWETGPLAHAADRIERAFHVGVVLTLVIMLPSSLGRADYNHVFFAGLGTILVAATLLSQRKAWAARTAVGVTAGAVGLAVIANAGAFFLQPAQVAVIAASRTGLVANREIPSALVDLGASSSHARELASQVASGTDLGASGPPQTQGALFAPLGFVDDYGWILAREERLSPDFYRRLSNLATDADWEKLKRRILASPLLIVPTSRYNAGPQPAVAFDAAETWRLYQLPVGIEFKRPRLTHEKELFETFAGYGPVEQVGGYTVLRLGGATEQQ